MELAGLEPATSWVRSLHVLATGVCAKKAAVVMATGRLACEACDVDFSERYGERAEGFIECHHTRPVSTLKPGQRTGINDLALLCSNCHRVLHLRQPWLTVDEVKDLLK